MVSSPICRRYVLFPDMLDFRHYFVSVGYPLRSLYNLKAGRAIGSITDGSATGGSIALTHHWRYTPLLQGFYPE